MKQNVQFVVLGTGEGDYESAFRDLANQYPGRVSVNTFFNEGFSRKVYADLIFSLCLLSLNRVELEN